MKLTNWKVPGFNLTVQVCGYPSTARTFYVEGYTSISACPPDAIVEWWEEHVENPKILIMAEAFGLEIASIEPLKCPHDFSGHYFQGRNAYSEIREDGSLIMVLMDYDIHGNDLTRFVVHDIVQFYIGDHVTMENKAREFVEAI